MLSVPLRNRNNQNDDVHRSKGCSVPRILIDKQLCQDSKRQLCKLKEIIFFFSPRKIVWKYGLLQQSVLFCRLTYQSPIGFKQVGQCSELFGSFKTYFQLSVCNKRHMQAFKDALLEEIKQSRIGTIALFSILIPFSELGTEQ